MVKAPHATTLGIACTDSHSDRPRLARACKPARARQLCRDCARDTAAVTFVVQDALEFDLNNGATPVTPIYRLEVVVNPHRRNVGDRSGKRPAERGDRRRAGNLSACRNHDRQGRGQRQHVCPRQLEYSWDAAALRQAEGSGRRTKPRRQCRRRSDPQQTGFVFPESRPNNRIAAQVFNNLPAGFN